MNAAIYEPSAVHDPDRTLAPAGADGLRAWCAVDLGALRHNAAVLRARAGVPIVPMVKADAYGLGVEAVSRALGAPFATPCPIPGVPHERAGDVTPWALGVATVREAEQLRALGATGRVLCTSPVLPEELARLAQARTTPALHREADVRAWRALTPAPWHLGIDTGMQRAGVPWREVEALRDVVAEHPPEGVFTHFHSADRADGTRELQEARFRDALARLPLPADTLRHTDNSWAHVARSPSPWELTRPGIALYGSPSDGPLGLRPVLHVHARIVDLRDVRPGDTVSYEGTFTATRATRIATIAIGHADGYRRAFSNRGVALLHGRRVPVAGVVTMDMTMLDVTDVPCAVGDVVTLLGTDARGSDVLTLDEVAALGALSPYELLVGWRLRLPRVYRP
jgi:alanine racemase